MGLITCPECQNAVSDKAEVCPKCGYPIAKYLQSEAAQTAAPQNDTPQISSSNEKTAAKFNIKKLPLKTIGIVCGAVLLACIAAATAYYFINRENISVSRAEAYTANQEYDKVIDVLEEYKDNPAAKQMYDDAVFMTSEEGQFIIDFADGLKARWDASSKNPDEDLKLLINMETEKLDKYKEVTFDDEVFNQKAHEYITALDNQLKALSYINTDYTQYANIKNSYDKKDYEDVVKRVSELPETYTQYETKDEIENMREKSQDILDERALIQTKLQAMRNNLSAEAYDMVIITADELLELNITNEEKEEVEKAKTTAEAKIEEQKAAAAKAEQEARQNRINNAIKISAAELYEAFTTNEVGADNKYKNKTLIVTGDIYQIDKVFLFGNPVIYLQAGYTADAIYASFSKSDADGLTDLKQGQTVRILGQCTGYSLGSVMLSDCSVIE